MCGRDREFRSQGFDQGKDDGGSESIFFCRSANAAGAKDRFVPGYGHQAGWLGGTKVDLPYYVPHRRNYEGLEERVQLFYAGLKSTCPTTFRTYGTSSFAEASEDKSKG